MDVGIVGDRIVAVGNLDESAREEIDAKGRIVAPGFVDIHTHYDGQATWDQEMAPSAWHGVTTVVMGNCGVGFAGNFNFYLANTNSLDQNPRTPNRIQQMDCFACC